MTDPNRFYTVRITDWRLVHLVGAVVVVEGFLEYLNRYRCRLVARTSYRIGSGVLLPESALIPCDYSH